MSLKCSGVLQPYSQAVVMSFPFAWLVARRAKEQRSFVRRRLRHASSGKSPDSVCRRDQTQGEMPSSSAIEAVAIGLERSDTHERSQERQRACQPLAVASDPMATVRWPLRRDSDSLRSSGRTPHGVLSRTTQSRLVGEHPDPPRPSAPEAIATSRACRNPGRV